MNRQQILNDTEASLRLALDGRLAVTWTAMPCIVNSVSFSTMTLSARPCIQGIQVLEDGTTTPITIDLLLDVPIVFPSAGGFTLTLPIARGDEILVVFASRCIDAWWQSGGVQRPLELRMHDLSDGFAIPGPKSLPNTITSISSTGAQLRNNAGTTYLEIAGDGKIKIMAPAEIDITAPLVNVVGNLVVSGSMTSASIATTGTGDATIGGNVNATGNVTGAQVSAGAIALSTHKHTGVTTGSGTSGGPTP